MDRLLQLQPCSVTQGIANCSLDWDFLHKQWGRSKQRLAAGAYTQNDMSRTRKFQFEPSHGELSPISCPWGSGPSGAHSIRSDGPKIENLLWKPYIPSIFCLMKKVVVLSFFGLCKVKISQILTNFTKACFWSSF